MEQNVKPLHPQTINGSEKAETVRDLVHRHLNDKNHVTTDEELRNVVFDFNLDEPKSFVETNIMNEHLNEATKLLNDKQSKFATVESTR